MKNNNKLRIAYLYHILSERTDENNPVSTAQIIDIMANEHDYEPHRTTIAEDIEVLRDMGVDVCTIKSTRNKYFIGERKFELPEIKLLIDAMESSKFITQKKTDELVNKLLSLISKNQAEVLRKGLNLGKTVKPENEHVYYIVEVINRAIFSSKKILFKYYEYDVDKNKKLKNNGKNYVLSPYNLIWNNDYYYVVGYSEKHKRIVSFRVDRILNIPAISDDKAVPAPENFDISQYSSAVFEMFTGNGVPARLRCDDDMMKVIMDRFGDDVHTKPCGENCFIAEVDVSRSPRFFAWIFGFEGKIKILEPESLRNQYRNMIEETFRNL